MTETQKAAFDLFSAFRKLACQHDRDAKAIEAKDCSTPVDRRWLDYHIVEARRLRRTAREYLRMFAR